MKKLIYLLLITYYLMFAGHTLAQSKSDFNLSINPSILEIETHAPANPEAKINLENKSDKDITLDIIIKPFTRDALGTGQIKYYAEDEANKRLSEVKDKVKVFENHIAVSKIKLSPFETKELALKIDINDDFPKQDYYFTVLFAAEGGKST